MNRKIHSEKEGKCAHSHPSSPHITGICRLIQICLESVFCSADPASIPATVATQIQSELRVFIASEHDTSDGDAQLGRLATSQSLLTITHCVAQGSVKIASVASCWRAVVRFICCVGSSTSNSSLIDFSSFQGMLRRHQS